MSKASRLKGHCNRLFAINQLPVHQRESLFGGFPFGLEEGGGSRMRSYRRIALLALAAIVSCFSNPTFAAANDISSGSQPEQSSSAPSCGKTVDAKLAAARKALQANDNATRTALACLIAATSALNEEVHNNKIGKPTSGMLAAPVRVDAPKLGQ